MRLRRRSFLKIGGTSLLLSGLNPGTLLPQNSSSISPSSPFYEQLTSDEFPFPYDVNVFEASERIFNVRRNPDIPDVWLTNLNLLLKAGKTLDLKILVADTRGELANPRETLSYTGVSGTFNTVIHGYDSPRLYYQVQYREGQQSWKALPPRNFKLPNARLREGGRVQALFIADDHNFDDGDYGVTPEYRQTKITGDYMVDFLKGLRRNTQWLPAYPLDKFKFSLALIRAVRYILAHEDPDFLVNLGDTNGIGASYRWESWGLPFRNLTDSDYDYIAKTLWLRMRKAFAGLTPNMPTYIALGNHDGDENWNSGRFRAKYWRQQFFTLPDQATYPEGGHPEGNYYAFSWGSDRDNRGGAQFIMLDTTAFCGPAYPARPEQWTLGAEQRLWFENVVSQSEHDWSFACHHHVLGGWPAGSTEDDRSLAYGRGPLFSESDYAPYADPARVEQVKLTNLGKQNGLRGFIYGHDHIFKVTRIGQGANQREIHGVCAGSTKYIGETPWWNGTYWQRHYGNGFKSGPDFWGPSGITRLTLKNDQAKVDYICTGRTPYTNLPSGGLDGVAYSSYVIVNPAPSIAVDKTELTLQAVQRSSLPPPSEILKIRNSGGRPLQFNLVPSQDWIRVSPERDVSWFSWSEVSVFPFIGALNPGTYNGTIRIECPEAANSPVLVQVQAEIFAPIYPPLNFRGRRTRANFSTSREDTILLGWRQNPLNSEIQRYRLYLLDSGGNRTFLGEVGSGTYGYAFLRAQKTLSYRFAVVAVNSRGREGEAATAVVAQAA